MKFLEANLLDHLERPEFADLYSALEPEYHAKGNFVSQPGDQRNRIFIVVHGRVRIYLGYEEKEFSLGILTRGDIYSSHTPTFVQALTDATLLTANVETFRQRMVGDPEITKAMVRVLGNILERSFSIIDSLAFKDVGARLIALLSYEARKHGSVQGDGSIEVEIDLSTEHLARLVGSSRQTISMLLNELIRGDLVIRPRRGLYVIQDIQALEHAGGIGIQ
ncbi:MULTISPECIES: Crp/Fnr family transcriptional regulator [Desulfosediminicola]|uniref:Crp/Fnr family transcriptional regulator n=1 Tax=Desulfosediminicola TaxID=2886823 RepID=UPI0010ABA19E|nr:Crp/Fnr family transcriptional regulator [Desulfosediminicola ganghwensis]